MKTLLRDLAKLIDAHTPEDGYRQCDVPNLVCAKISTTGKRNKAQWMSTVAIVASGCKEVTLGREIYRAEVGHFSVSPVELPVVSRAIADEKPFLCVLIRLSPEMLSEAASAFDDEKEASGALFLGEASEPMLECAIKLLKLKGKDAKTLGPLAMKELLYHVMKTSLGPELRSFVRQGSTRLQISKTLHDLKTNLADEVDVDKLARTARMSRSAFFKHFKDVAAMSPIQYQKRLRLFEARRLMIDEQQTAESAAYRVGYKSASQFSREYARMFGASPARHSRKLRQP